MKRSMSGAVCAIALLCASVPLATATFTSPAYAQQYAASFDRFHSDLSRYGDWVYSDRWGEVWMPDAGPDFHPYYSDGYWADTIDYGWMWVSDYPWGDITFHYGRWVDDPYDGWMWIPGYVWSPAWVVWRGSDREMGWMPMPPDRDFIAGAVNFGGGGLNFSINYSNYDDYYGYRNWYGPDYSADRFARMWVFMDTNRFGDRDFRRYARPRTNNLTIINNTTNITNYTVVNNFIVNRSVDNRRLERAGGRRSEPVRAETVMRNRGNVTRVDEGRRVQQEMRQRMPVGRGEARSAPAPTQAVVNTLSDRTPRRRGGGGESRVFTRQNIDQAPGGNQAAGAGQTRDRREERAAAPQQQPQREEQARQDRQRQDQTRQDQERAAQQRTQDQSIERRFGQERAQEQRVDRERQGQARQEQGRQEQARQDQQRQAQQQEQSRAERQRQDEARGEQARQERARQDQQRQAQQQEQARGERQRQDQARGEQARQERGRQDQQRQAQQQEQARAQQARAQQQQQQQEQAQAQQRQQQQVQRERQGRGRERAQPQPQPQEQPQAQAQPAQPEQQRAAGGESRRGGRGRDKDDDKKD